MGCVSHRVLLRLITHKAWVLRSKRGLSILLLPEWNVYVWSTEISTLLIGLPDLQRRLWVFELLLLLHSLLPLLQLFPDRVILIEQTCIDHPTLISHDESVRLQDCALSEQTQIELNAASASLSSYRHLWVFYQFIFIEISFLCEWVLQQRIPILLLISSADSNGLA